MARAFLGLGSNIGDREKYLYNAIDLLKQSRGITWANQSSLYETDPYGPVEQDNFLNMVVEVETELSPEELLTSIQSIELELNRKREIHWGPRTIDLDILIYDNIQMTTKNLTIPHPELSKRLFVLIPLNEIEPYIIVPGFNVSVNEMLKRFKEIKGVRVWKQRNGEGE